MKVYWPMAIKEKGDPVFGNIQYTTDSCTSWEEVEEVFECWLIHYNMKFKKMFVEVVDLDLEDGDPNRRHTYELDGGLIFKGTIGKEVDREEVFKHDNT